MFSVNGLIEMLKSLLKVSLALGCGIIVIWQQFNELMHLGTEDTPSAIWHAIHLFMFSFAILAAVFILVTSLDVPLQIWQFFKKQRMSTQET